MRMSCGRSDGEPPNQACATRRACASARRSPAEPDYYNRLEYGRAFRLFGAARGAAVRWLPAAAEANAADDRDAFGQIPASGAFLSLLQVRKSCHKQLGGVTPFRRGIAQ
jgi:hypothetical protein